MQSRSGHVPRICSHVPVMTPHTQSRTRHVPAYAVTYPVMSPAYSVTYPSCPPHMQSRTLMSPAYAVTYPSGPRHHVPSPHQLPTPSRIRHVSVTYPSRIRHVSVTYPSRRGMSPASDAAARAHLGRGNVTFVTCLAPPPVLIHSHPPALSLSLARHADLHTLHPLSLTHSLSHTLSLSLSL